MDSLITWYFILIKERNLYSSIWRGVALRPGKANQVHVQLLDDREKRTPGIVKSKARKLA